MNYKSLRPVEMHPRNDIMLNKQTGIIYVYASPVDKKTGMIGDWGMTIYFGRDPEIILEFPCHHIIQLHFFIKTEKKSCSQIL